MAAPPDLPGFAAHRPRGRAILRAEARVYHLRTRDRLQEIDPIAERYDGAVIAIEVKPARTVDDRDVRHLHWLGNQLGERRVDKLVIHAGPAAYRRPDGVAVVPLALMG